MRDLKVTGVDGTDLQLVDQDGGRYRLAVDDRVLETLLAMPEVAVVPAAPASGHAADADPTADDLAAEGSDADDPRTDEPRTDDPGAEQSDAAVEATTDDAAGQVNQSRPPILTAVATPSSSPSPEGSTDLPSLPPGEMVTPRTVQELLRAGHSVQQVAAAAGWDLAKVERYAAPIEAERSYTAGLARDLPVATTAGDAAATVGQRVAGRLHDRGVLAETVVWDARRTAGSGWIVVCRFSAGGRIREASWQFRPATRTLTAIDDEARWLGEDEHATTERSTTPRAPVKVFDVEAEGGVTEAVDLVSAMQARSRDRRARGARGSRVGRAQSVPAVAADEIAADADEPAVDRPTVDDLGHDPVTGTVDLFTETTLRPPADPSTTSSDAPSAVGEVDAPAADLDTAHGNGAAAQASGAADADPSDPAASDPAASDPAASDPAASAPSDLVALNSEPAAAEHASPGPQGRESSSTTDGSDASKPGADEVDDADEGAVASQDDQSDSGPANSPAPPPRRPGNARSGRPSVPSWDDIMFGGRRGRD